MTLAHRLLGLGTFRYRRLPKLRGPRYLGRLVTPSTEPPKIGTPEAEGA